MSISDWLQENATILSAAGNLMLVVIWGTYLHMFFRQSQRHQKAELLIHRAQGPDDSATCLLVNLSKEVVHVQCVILQVETQQEKHAYPVTAYDRVAADGADTTQGLREGPLAPGDYLVLGGFEDILPGLNTQQESSNEHEGSPPVPGNIQALELCAVAVHGPSDYLIGARRRFVVDPQEGQMRIYPKRLRTEQLNSRRDRNEVHRWLRDSLKPSRID